MPMTNAERQKRYRDKRRGCPPAGRWGSGYLSAGKHAELLKVSRTMIFMARWIDRHAPDVTPKLESGEVRVTPTYKRLMAEYSRAMIRAVQEEPDGGGYELHESRRDGQFVFTWVPTKKKRKRPT